MWELISDDFARTPSQADVAKYMMDIGVRVEKTKLFIDKVPISHSQLAKALKKDKRIVTATVRTIISNPRLYSIYSRVRPACNLIDVAPEMGWGVVELILSDPAMPGVLGSIAETIGDTGVSIRQAIGEDPTYSTGLLYIITETPLPGFALQKLRKIKGVEKITLH